MQTGESFILRKDTVRSPRPDTVLRWKRYTKPGMRCIYTQIFWDLRRGRKQKRSPRIRMWSYKWNILKKMSYLTDCEKRATGGERWNLSSGRFIIRRRGRVSLTTFTWMRIIMCLTRNTI